MACRFVSGTDPAEAGALRRFEAVRGRTECIFARGTRLWGSPDWERGELERNLDRFAERLSAFVAVADSDELDGIVLEVAEPDAGSTVEELAATTRAVVEGLIARDPAASETPIEDPEWWLTFAGSPLFVATFAPCYDASSSRYGFGLERTYLLFQTRGSFVRRWSPRTGALSESARRKIRIAFERAGRPYDLSITLSPLEAHRYVKPARLGAPPVEWWKAPPRREGDG